MKSKVSFTQKYYCYAKPKETLAEIKMFIEIKNSDFSHVWVKGKFPLSPC